MKILAAVNWLNRGGIETMLLQALPWLRRGGIEMDFCCLGPGALDAEFAAQGCTVWRIPKSGNCRRTAQWFRDVAARRPYAAVHSHLGHTSGGFALGAARQGLPVIVSIHSEVPLSLYRWRTIPGLRQLRSAWLRWHRRLMERHVNVFVGHSVTNVRAFAANWQQAPQRYRVVMNGIEFPAELPSRQAARERLGVDDQTLLLLHVGTFKEEKNHAGLLQILAQVASRYQPTRLVLVGDGPLRAAIEGQARELGLDGRVLFVGTQADCWSYYAAADVLVFPSTTEGFGNVLVEGQGAGLPVVASDLPAHHESVVCGQQRFLFPLPQYERAADLILEQYTAARGQRNPWVAASRQEVRARFSVQRLAADFQRLYTELAS